MAILVPALLKDSATTRSVMTKTANIVIIFVIVAASLAVVIGNTFAIFVFWKNRNRLQRTSFLLINLAVADLFVGFSQAVISAALQIPRQLEDGGIKSASNLEILAPVLIAFSFKSVLFLVLISLERAYALIWPLRHRVASLKGYIYSAIFVWAAGAALGALTLLAANGIFDFGHWVAAICCFVVLALTLICVSYLAIRTRMANGAAAIDTAHNRQRASEQIKKLSKTLFIVISTSIVCWIPSVVLYCVNRLCFWCVPVLVILIFKLCRLANSLLNPIVYCFRIPMFREALKQMMPRKQSKEYTVNYVPRNFMR